MGDPVIQTHNLVRRFGDLAAVNDLTFEVTKGEVFGFLGHNGAGKTTTVRLLNGVLLPTDGTISVLGLDPVTQGPTLRARTGVLTESPSLDERMTARENLTVYAELYGVPKEKVDARLEELFHNFGLTDRADEKVGGYSKGMKQRMALARSLLHEPEVLFLDEPTAGLDPVAAKEVRDLMVHLSAEGRTVFLCTHNLVEAQKLCDRVAVLEHGKLLALGTPTELGQRFSSRQRLEIEVSPDTLETALEALNAMRGISEIEQSNHTTLAFSGADYDSVPDVVSLLVADGVRLHRVTPLEASLEDVYFALHDEAEREFAEVAA